MDSFILMAYSSKVHNSTEMTPFKLMFGRRMPSLDSGEDGRVTLEDSGNADGISRRARQLMAIMTLQETVRMRILDSQGRARQAQDARSRKRLHQRNSDQALLAYNGRRQRRVRR